MCGMVEAHTYLRRVLDSEIKATQAALDRAIAAHDTDLADRLTYTIRRFTVIIGNSEAGLYHD